MPSDPVLARTAILADLRGAIAKVAAGNSLTQEEAAEAFDLVLQSGAATPPGMPADSTDHLWLTPHP